METDPSLRFRLEASVAPSEDPGKVAAAVSNVVQAPIAEVTIFKDRVVFESKGSDGLVHLRDQLRDRHVRSAARRFLLRNRTGDRATLMLNRQAAHVGVVALCGDEKESPLGPVFLSLESKHLDKVVDWLTGYETP